MSLSTVPARTAAGDGAGGRSAPVAAPAEARRHELAAFLRSRRERIAPDQVGLPVTGRRRTPGLRREEVAQLAAVGVTWYTWLEQGRAIQVSVQVLDAVARALLLDRNERAHLFALAGADDPSPVLECATVTPAVRLMLDQFGPMPAAVVNSRYDILAHNHAYTHLAGDLEAQPFEERNLLWMAFTPSRFQDVLVDVEVEREGMVARFRSAMADHSAEPAWKALVTRLRQASPDFEAAWARHEVARPGNGVKRFLVPGAGLLSFDYTGLWLGPRAGSRLIVYTPRCEETRERMAVLAAR
ncbi:DNA-binding protein [Kitasatospora indigofera]|uniref:DNA-binding protein n=1 Tax=Kitasatospora indigofera TaxID=67307 RepID=A0A919FGJ5_9ACTN|nr:helix-turn-helix transcriptional regulator [Kitasatospora indigofera]GHH64092.1 DNA-binding protein [Kitasatospora indigofera]